MTILLYLLAALLIALNAADWRTTRAAILSGRGREANPFMAFLIARFGLDRALIGKGVGVAAFGVWIAASAAKTAPYDALATLLVINAIYVWVIRNNLRALNP